MTMTMTQDAPSERYQNAIKAMRPAIDQLLKNYEGFTSRSSIEKQHAPDVQLNHFLDNIDLHYPGATHRKLKLAIRSFISSLDCFKYRVIARTKIGTEAWNPLEQSFKNFISKHSGCEIIYRQDASAYPTADLISDWITQHLSENIYSNPE